MSKELAINSYTFTPAYGYSLAFDGTNDYINITDKAAYNFGTGDFTIEVIFRLNVLGVRQDLVVKKDNTTKEYSIFIGSDNKVNFFTSGTTLTTSAALIALTGYWYHVVAKRTGTTTNIFVNGVKMATGTSSANVTSTGYNVRIGANGTTSTAAGVTPSNMVNGYISDVRLWSDARTDDEISYYSTRALRGSEANLVGYWPLNQSSGTTATDISSSPTNGTLVNFPASPWSTNIPPIYQKTFVDRFDQFALSTFSSSINSGVGDATITLPIKSTDLNDAHNKGNDIEIIVYDQESQVGTQIYSGYIEKTETESGAQESVEIQAKGNVTRLALDNVQNYASQFNFQMSSADLGTQFKLILDYYKYWDPRSPITYTASNIATVGVSQAVDLDNTSYLDALNMICKMAGSTYYWYLGPDDQMIFMEYNTVQDHIFTFGADIVKSGDTNSIAETRNAYYFAGNATGRYYKDETSQLLYGRRVETKNDGRFTVNASMDAVGSSFIATHKDPFDIARVEVLDSNFADAGYDIETVRPGHVIYRNNSGQTETNQLISHATYKIGTLEIATTDVERFVEREAFELRQRIDQIGYGGNGPVTYTSV